MRAPRFERKRVAVLEEAHGQLTDRCAALAAMRYSVDQKTARTANTFTTIMFEGNGRLLAVDQIFVQHVEHFEKRHFRGHIVYSIAGEAARCGGALLPPDSEREIHATCNSFGRAARTQK